MKRIIITVLFLTILCGCSKDSVKIEMKDKIYEGNGYKITMEIPEIHDDSEFSNNFNSEYITLADKMLNDFSSEAEKSDISNDYLNLKQEIKFNKNGIISIVGNCKAFTDSSHETLSRIVKNIDIKNQRNILLNNLFNDNEYITRINSYIEVMMQTNPDNFTGLWKTPVISENQNFYITQNGIVIFYNPYELSYYSKGFVEIEIPYEELESYLNPEYAERIWK